MRNRYYIQARICMAAVLLLWTAACADEPGVGMKSDVVHAYMRSVQRDCNSQHSNE